MTEERRIPRLIAREQLIGVERSPDLVILHIRGEGDIALSLSEEEVRRPRQYLYTPKKELVKVPKPEEISWLREFERRKLEHYVLRGINKLRGENGASPLERITIPDPAAFMASFYASNNPDERLTHQIPYEALIELPLDLLGSFGIETAITPKDLEEIGMQPGYVAGSMTRTSLASNKLGFSETHQYARHGGVSEVLVRGGNLDPESAVDALRNSPPHFMAMTNQAYKHAGVAVWQGETGIVTAAVVLGRGLNTSVDWPKSKRWTGYKSFAPSFGRT